MKIVLSYRRSDTEEISGRIFDRLRSQFGHDSVFMDVDSIPFGVDFRRHIQKELEGCDVLLTIIGPHWLGGGRGLRIKEESDFVRLEVETALQRGIPVVPVLVRGAKMPRPDQLPETLRDLTFRNAAPVDSGRDFHSHVDRVIRSLGDLLRETTEQKRLAREQEEARRQADSQDQTLTGIAGSQALPGTRASSTQNKRRLRWAAAGLVLITLAAGGIYLREQQAAQEAAQAPAAQEAAQAPAAVKADQEAAQATARSLLRTFTGHSDDVWSVAFSPDGQRVLSGSGDKTLRLWDANRGSLLRTFTGHSSSVSSVAFSPDGQRVLSGSSDKTLRLWDVSSGTAATGR